MRKTVEANREYDEFIDEFFKQGMAIIDRIGGLDGIKVIMRTKDEVGHGRPHVHIDAGGTIASVGILDGEVIEGKLRSSQLADVRDWLAVEANRDKAMSKWREYNSWWEG